MADTDPTGPGNTGGDRELLRLGGEHMALLDAYRAARRRLSSPEDPRERVAKALYALEDRIAGVPARTAAGLVVRLRALWTSLGHSDTDRFRPPRKGDGLVHRLAWGVLQDAKRLARRP